MRGYEFDGYGRNIDSQLKNLRRKIGFWRGKSTAETHGTGIGLAVVSELVDAHHGTVHVANRRGDAESP